MRIYLSMALLGAAMLMSSCSTLHKSDATALQGKWSGYEVGSSPKYACRLIIRGHDLEFRGAATNDWCKGTFTLREDTVPKQIVGVITECNDPQSIGKAVHAIYQLEGGTLLLAGNVLDVSEAPPSFDSPNTRRLELTKR